ncbi:acyltransferase family protein (plasmid) [Pseudoalteromonas sp. T1lg65]|uniref:acyltransferase family protein n=1 Tax=Pseudoalteromonas sp. T1lg65 TaxID=2077101 RepID=UPI003F7969AD
MNTRFYEIDLLRFLCALGVVIFHYTYTAHMEGFAPIADFPLLREFTRYAYMGINFFFVISGFVILMSVSSRSLAHFLKSRFIRLFPAYWAALLLTTLVTLYIGGDKFTVSPAQFIANITMVNEAMNYAPIDSAYWTLYIEIKFYLFMAVILLIRGLRYLEAVIGVVLIASLLILFTPWSLEINMFTAIFPHWSGYFAAGCTLYLTKQHGVNIYRAGLLLLSLCFVVVQSTKFGGLMASWFNIEFDPFIIATINVIFFAIFLISALCEKHPLRLPVFYYFGILTYPLYLVHQHIGYMIFNQFGEQKSIALLVALCILLMLALAAAIHYIVEKPASRLLKRLWERPKQVEASIKESSYRLR